MNKASLHVFQFASISLLVAIVKFYLVMGRRFFRDILYWLGPKMLHGYCIFQRVFHAEKRQLFPFSSTRFTQQEHNILHLSSACITLLCYPLGWTVTVHVRVYVWVHWSMCGCSGVRYNGDGTFGFWRATLRISGESLLFSDIGLEIRAYATWIESLVYQCQQTTCTRCVARRVTVWVWVDMRAEFGGVARGA